MDIATIVPWMAVATILTKELLWMCAVGLAISGLDDFAVDLVWLRLRFERHFRRISAEVAPEVATQRAYAVLVPAWDEAAVIGAMLRRLLDTQQHDRFYIFVGCYPNDPETIDIVSGIADARVTHVVMDRVGPTTKADCLNRLWVEALGSEARLGLTFDAIILHDAEDVVHPKSFAVYDRYLADFAMVQLPVVPFLDPESRWVSGHYADDFAQAHAKDMLVRGFLGTAVPSAGVGTAIRMDAMRALCANGRLPFDPASLTEDYELGHKLHHLGFKGVMVREFDAGGRLISTQEFFPSTIETAVRQKARWLTGIALAGWDRLGWSGGWRGTWMLLRDRKSVFSAAVSMISYAAAILALAQIILLYLVADQAGYQIPALISENMPALRNLMVFNALLLTWRLLLRAYFTSKIYGFSEGLRAIPRAVVGNMINFMAAVRAAQRYRKSIEQGQTLKWDKTQHRFPSETPDLLVEGRRG